jgi:ABC-type Zn2+ transport system substrate-binding protein/surface adhesin
MNATSIKNAARNLQKDYAIAHNLEETSENISAAKGRIEMRTSYLKAKGFKVFADEHDVMLLAA